MITITNEDSSIVCTFEGIWRDSFTQGQNVAVTSDGLVKRQSGRIRTVLSFNSIGLNDDEYENLVNLYADEISTYFTVSLDRNIKHLGSNEIKAVFTKPLRPINQLQDSKNEGDWFNHVSFEMQEQIERN